MKNLFRIALLSVLILSLVFCFAGCKKAPAEEPTTAPSTTEPSTLPPPEENLWYSLSDGILSVSLEANATTGYTWSYEISDTNVVECQGDKYVEDEHEDGMVGVGGMFKGVFAAATTDGEAKITFNYARSWEKDVAPIRTCSVTVKTEGNKIIDIIDHTDIIINETF